MFGFSCSNPNGPTVAPPGKIDIESLKQESQPSSSTSSAITSSSHHQMPENMSDSVQLNLHMQTDNRRKRFAIEGTIRESLIRNLNKRNSIYFESGKDQPASEEEMEDESVEQSNEDSEEETEAAEREVNNHDRLDYEEEAVEQNQIKMHIPFWDTYDTINQLYIELSEFRI